MSVDLKGNWTDADIAKLIGSVVDDRDWRLEVDANGVANLSDKTTNPTGADYDETLHCFLETWMQGLTSSAHQRQATRVSSAK